MARGQRGWARKGRAQKLQPSAAPGVPSQEQLGEVWVVRHRARAAAVPVWRRCHRGPVTGLATSPDGSLLFSSCSSGTLAQYQCVSAPCRVLRVAGEAPTLPLPAS